MLYYVAFFGLGSIMLDQLVVFSSGATGKWRARNASFLRFLDHTQ